MNDDVDPASSPSPTIKGFGYLKPGWAVRNVTSTRYLEWNLAFGSAPRRSGEGRRLRCGERRRTILHTRPPFSWMGVRHLVTTLFLLLLPSPPYTDPGP